VLQSITRELRTERHKRYNQGMGNEWISDEELAALAQPLDPPGKYEAIAQKRLRQLAPDAVNVIVEIMNHSENDKTRLDAAKYVLDRALGKIEAPATESGTRPAWQDIIDSVIVEPNAAARAAGQAIERRSYND